MRLNSYPSIPKLPGRLPRLPEHFEEVFIARGIHGLPETLVVISEKLPGLPKMTGNATRTAGRPRQIKGASDRDEGT